MRASVEARRRWSLSKRLSVKRCFSTRGSRGQVASKMSFRARSRDPCFELEGIYGVQSDPLPPTLGRRREKELPIIFHRGRVIHPRPACEQTAPRRLRGHPSSASQLTDSPCCRDLLVEGTARTEVLVVPTACRPPARAWPQAGNLPRGQGLPENKIPLACSRPSDSNPASAQPLAWPAAEHDVLTGTGFT